MSGESDQQPVVKSNEIPNISVSEVIQSTPLSSSEPTTVISTTPKSTTLATPVQQETKKVSTGAIKVNRFTINYAETTAESKCHKCIDNILSLQRP